MKTFIKYCGGKAKLLNFIKENIPNFNNYYEPFVGGGSVIFGLIDTESSTNYNISDINKNLINCYSVIKDSLELLLLELSKDIYENYLDIYLANRETFNKIKFLDTQCVERAALFIYLNKCGFNGMYRENKKGIFNIPFGKMKSPKILDTITLENCSKALKNVSVSHAGYKSILSSVQKDDFVYLDPPYDETFTGYTSEPFGKKEQTELKEFIDVLGKKGVKVMMSNSDTDFIKSLYSDYKIIILETKYSIGGKNASRSTRQEVLVTNY